MSKKVLLIIVIISMAFNISFISMFIYHRVLVKSHTQDFKPPEPHRFPKFREKYREAIEEIRPLQVEFHRSKHDFMMSLQNEDFNEELLRQKLENTIKKQVELEKEIGLKFIKFRGKMNIEQARFFFRNLPGAKNIQHTDRKLRKFINNRRKK